MIRDKLILVDERDNVLGFEEKERCHNGEGILHRAFSVFVFNDYRQLLIQQRSKFKRLWPLYWSNTCCSHPRKGEDIEKSAWKRLDKEMGFNCSLKYLYKFRYYSKFNDEGSENELCAVFLGRYGGDEIVPNLEEIADFKWIGLEELIQDIDGNQGKYTPWFKMEVRRLTDNCMNELEKLFR